MAALVTPIVAQAVRVGGWGVLDSTTAVVRIETAASPEDGLARTPIVPLSQRVSRNASRSFVMTSARLDPPEVPPVSAAGPPTSVRSPGPGQFPGRGTAIGAWAVLCSLAVIRLAASFFRGIRLVRRATPVDDGRLRQAAARALYGLGLRFEPEIRTSRAIRCPSVWCWARRPLLLTPRSRGRLDRLGRRLLSRAGPLATARPHLGAGRPAPGVRAPLEPAGLVDEISDGTACRAGLRRLGPGQRAGGGRLRGLAAGADASAWRGRGTGGGLEREGAGRQGQAYPGRPAEQPHDRFAVGSAGPGLHAVFGGCHRAWPSKGRAHPRIQEQAPRIPPSPERTARPGRSPLG